MKKTVIASALALAIGGVSVAEAGLNTPNITGTWTGTYQFSMLSPGGGGVGGVSAPQAWTWEFDASSSGTVAITNATTFFGSVWTAHDVTFDMSDATATGWYGNDAPATGAVNTLFDWSASTNIPLTTAWHVTTTGSSLGDAGIVSVHYSTITAGSGDFPGFHPQFSGSLTKTAKLAGGEVPIPAAAWLMGSGLIGLVGVARRRRRS